MGNTITVGRLNNPADLTLIAQGLPVNGVEEYRRYSNYSLEYFVEYLNSLERVESSKCFALTNIDSFLLECDQKMPKIFPEMDDLDCHCAGQVLDTLPYILMTLKKAVNEDIVSGRKSHYFINIT